MCSLLSDESISVIYLDVVSPPLFTTLLWVRQVYVFKAITPLHHKIEFLHKGAQSLSYGPFSSLLATCLLPSQKPPIF